MKVLYSTVAHDGVDCFWSICSVHSFVQLLHSGAWLNAICKGYLQLLYYTEAHGGEIAIWSRAAE